MLTLFAQDLQLPGYKVTIPQAPKSPATGQPYQDLGSIVGALLPYVFFIAVFVFLIIIIFGGFQWMTSQGDPKATQAARARITSAIIGLVIIFVAYWMMRMVGVIFHIPLF